MMAKHILNHIRIVMLLEMEELSIYSAFQGKTRRVANCHQYDWW